MKPRRNMRSSVEILVVGNSLPAQAASLQNLLEENGYAVMIAPDGMLALAAARRRPPALIVSDVLMPQMNGFVLCMEIKRDEQLRDVPVILIGTLSGTAEILTALECGADNFISKPYEDHHLLARIDYLLTNNEPRKNQNMPQGMEIHLGEEVHFITTGRRQMVDLLISVYEDAVQISEKLKARQGELANSNSTLSGLYHVAEGLNRAVSEREICDQVLERAMDLPGVQAGWISLWENDAFHMAAMRNLPPALREQGAMEGMCECRYRFLAGKLDQATNILECERLKHAKGDTHGLCCHASVPLWSGQRRLGVMNLVGSDQGLFKSGELVTLYGIGHQVGIALERTRLHGHLEHLVEERTAALTREIAKHKSTQEKRSRLVAIIEATPDFVATTDLDGQLLYVNQAGLRMLGHEPEQDVSELRVGAGQPDWALKLILETGIPHATEHGTWSGETAFLQSDGKEIPVLQVIIAHKGVDGSLRYLSTIARDITQLKDHEARINRLNRFYSVLSGINTTIVRARDQQDLFNGACRIAVEHGKFVFAWIGTLDVDTQQINPTAKSGHDDGYLSRISLTTTQNAPGSCKLAARAMTQGKPVICNDIATDEAMHPLRAEALSRGYHSMALLPLIPEDRPVGIFVIYAAEANIFDAEEVRLLIEMAGDISFAMDHLEKKTRLNYLAYFNGITGLPNRTLFLDRVAQKILAAQRDGDALSMIMLDLNRFSDINETLGRPAGDSLLRQVAQWLQGILREADVLAHFSADYFGIVIQHDDESPGIAQLLERMLFGIQNQPFQVNDQELRVSLRAGVSSYPTDGDDTESLLRNAEAALKKAKISGEKYLFYTPAFNALVAGKLLLENKLRRALEQQQLVLHYQPKIDLASGRISGLEALLRWNDPERGLVLPLEFIPLLEETGMILEAGLWALEKAVSDSLAWQANGLQSPRVAVNVSPLQLQQKDFVKMIERVVKGDRDMAGKLELEITEGLVMRDIVANIQKLRVIRKMGMEVAIDDFGTGYSSLSYIAKLPADTLKVDRAFIMNMTSNSDDLSIVSTIISLAHSLNMRVVAEGVETDEQARLLRSLKCDEIQGFLFSTAVPAAQIEQFLRTDKSLLLA